MEKISRDQFVNDVKADLKKALACYDLSEEDFEAYINSEMDTIDGRYKGYEDSKGKDDDLNDEAFYKACVASTSYCLEMCFE